VGGTLLVTAFGAFLGGLKGIVVEWSVVRREIAGFGFLGRNFLQETARIFVEVAPSQGRANMVSRRELIATSRKITNTDVPISSDPIPDAVLKLAKAYSKGQENPDNAH
jgi:hypothetical protein